jgi:hypothetical protein
MPTEAHVQLRHRIPRPLARLLGYRQATTDTSTLGGVLADHTQDIWSSEPEQTRRALRILRHPLNWQPGLVTEYAQVEALTAYLHGLAAAAEANLDQANADHRSLLHHLRQAARTAGHLVDSLAAAAHATCPPTQAQPSPAGA